MGSLVETTVRGTFELGASIIQDPDVSGRMSNQILVPFDGSLPSKQALEYAFERFPDADVTAMYAVPTPGGYWAAFEGTETHTPGEAEARERGETLLKGATALADEHDRSLSTHLSSGKPDQEIIDTAVDEEFDAIVIGSHGREGVSRVLLGSVAERVVRRAPIPVIVVR
ncbi:Nucleotide-binding protein, UspA family [Natrarchaeobaculum sulfurireducens]|uniref:Nucleotide-binding protein, UspA family n=2 Tax=Natrarchaeobaculum sulfurireducens TaxID=2044521 RepID=A0A346PD16_9EURY|nr:Nucleotide-binding protein, UspA family [Natrarchaeobaculum sulfurireducens]